MKLSDKDPSTYRLQLFLSKSGVCARRKAMELIFQGKVKVDGKLVTEPSFKVDPQKNKVSVEDKMVTLKTYQYIIIHKPRGVMTTVEDRHARKTIMDYLPKSLQHLKPVGRLDKNTEGLLLLTNDGNLSFQLTHPRFHVDKVYVVQINGFLSDHQKKNLQSGIALDGKKTLPARIQKVHHGKGKTNFELVIREGRKRQIRRMLEALGHRVVALKRISQGPLRLGLLPKSQWRHLTPKEEGSLKEILRS